ncbi:MAG: cell division ATP-binding protein FtsE [Oscillospiraceae bacterium]|nr:cell division ATP-binding protein FtsE [Oscillospiraceae bacterium]
MVELKNVSVTYSNGVDALNNVSLKINDGDFVFVVGQSGAGKSTLIRLLLKEIEPTKGRINVNGFDVKRMRKSQTYNLRRTIGFVFQDFKLIDTMNVYDNIAFVLRCTDCKEKYIRKRVEYVVDLVGLKEKIYSKPGELSGGEQQRVAIARALVNDPKLIIADEPTGNLDPSRSREIIELLKAINDCGTTIMMVTHEHGLVKNYGGRIITLQEGRLVFDDVLTGKNEIDRS